MPVPVQKLLEQGERLAALHKRLTAWFVPPAFADTHADDVTYVREQMRGLGALVAWMDGRYRTIRARWRGWRRPGAPNGMSELASAFARISEWQSLREAMRTSDSLGRAAFPGQWKGVDSDWVALRRFTVWVAENRSFVKQHALPAAAIDCVLAGPPKVEPLASALDAASRLPAMLASWVAVVQWPPEYFATATVA